MVEDILPPAVVAVAAYDDPPDAVLFPGEEAAVAKAVPKRVREYTTVRHCARVALAKLGRPPAAIPRGERGAPQWPAGVVGSMTHCAGYRAAVLAESSAITTVGIDAETHDVLPDGVLDAVSLPDEREHIAALAAVDPSVHWDRLLFTAKESVYKAWFPLTRLWLGFSDARIRFDRDGTFTADLLVPGPVVDDVEVTGFGGRWLAGGGLIVAAIAVER